MMLGLLKKGKAKRKAADEDPSNTDVDKTDAKRSDEDGRGERQATARHRAPDPESDAKPDDVADVTGPTWKYTARKTWREFTDDECTDLAAALTYFAVLALFPALIAILSLLSLVGQADATVTAVTDIISGVGGASVASTLEPTVRTLATSPGGGIALVIGLATALWSASGYVMAFSRGMNRVYEIGEGRPVWKLRPMMLLITLVMVVMVVLIALLLVASGPVATTIGSTIGLSSTMVMVFQIAKWPVILILAILTVALLYYSTPNVKQPKFRWISVGAVFAIVVWILASVGFGFYVANFSSYSSTYGSLAGVIIFLLWLWITNIALLLGAEVDAELERARELQGGIEAEEEIQLPARDTSQIEKTEAKQAEDVQQGRALRESSGDSTESAEARDGAPAS